MVACSKRALPGITLSLIMTVSMAVPAMAGTETSSGHRKVVPQPLSHRATTTGRPSLTAKFSSPAGRSHVSARARAAEVSQTGGRTIRRTNFSGHIDHTLIDDGTLWSEHGSLATWQQTGMASWYGGKRWQGHRTSSGTAYDENALTAAHATLPLGTRVRVVSHNGARSVIVTINDRPGTRSRIIDLSREAAKQLGILDAGVAMVTLQPM